MLRKTMGPHHTNRVILLTGDGKGKTTSALGMVLRAVGHGLRVCVVQFIKQCTDTGEAQALRLLPGVEHLVCGKGFVRECTGEAFEAHAQAARARLAQAAERLCDPACGMVVLDGCAVRFRSGCWMRRRLSECSRRPRRNGRGVDRT